MRKIVLLIILLFTITLFGSDDIEKVNLIYERETKGTPKKHFGTTELQKLYMDRSVTVGRVNDPYTRWIMAEDDMGTQHFLCSFRIAPIGDVNVASYTLSVRGTGEGDYKKVRFKRKSDSQGKQVLDYTDSNGVNYRFTVAEHSRSGKTFQVKIDGDVPLPQGWTINPYQLR